MLECKNGFEIHCGTNEECPFPKDHKVSPDFIQVLDFYNGVPKQKIKWPGVIGINNPMIDEDPLVIIFSPGEISFRPIAMAVYYKSRQTIKRPRHVPLNKYGRD